MIHAWISLALQMPIIFLRKTWEKKRGLLELQVLLSTSRHSTASMAAKRRPTVPECLAYQIANCMAIWRQRRCEIASSMNSPSRCDLSL